MLIEEKIIIFRIDDWFNPPKAPIKADIITNKMISEDEFCLFIISNSIIGDIFWRVSKMRFEDHERPSVIAGIHRWNGAIPSLIIRAIVIRLKKQKLETGWTVRSEKIIRIEAIAWVRKYFSALSVLYLFWVIKIIGKNIIILISRENQAIIHVVVEKAMRIEAKRSEKIMISEGDVKMYTILI